jgi:hypothetical protein
MTTNPRPNRQPDATGWVRLAARASAGPSLAREDAGGYDAGGSSQDVRDAAKELARAAERLVDLATTHGRPEGGELGALRTTLHALDTAQAAAVELTSHVQQRGTAERSAGLPLEYLLALETRLTGPDRRMLASTAETLRTMPHLTAAFQAGLVGWAEVRAIVCEVRTLPVDLRAKIDDGFAEQNNIRRRDADRLLDEVRAAAAALRPDQANKDRVRDIERRFFHLQPQLGGSGGTGYFELDGEGFATVAAGLEAAMPAPSAGPNETSPPTRSATPTTNDDDRRQRTETRPSATPIPNRVRARQRADALVLLAESVPRRDTWRRMAAPRRARPRILDRRVSCHDLVGDVTSHVRPGC